jgi:predicted Zn-dependent peptidase
MSVIVCGSVGHKNLMKELQTSIAKLPKRKGAIVAKYKCSTTKDILISNKYCGNAIAYSYVIPREENRKFGSVFFEIMSHEMFKFFCKSQSMLSSYGINNIFLCGNNVRLVSLCPKKDVSLDRTEKMYNLFINRMSSVAVSQQLLAEIAANVNLRNRVALSSLMDVYDAIKDAYLAGCDVNFLHNGSNAIKNADPKSVKSFAEKFLLKNPIAKITTRFKLDD